ncbi:MAG TPA: alpha/beta hydrolase-fold protein, partial [Herpetosiphonaceae bacterium]
RLLRACCRYACDRSVALVLILAVAILAPLLLDWKTAQRLPSVEAKVTRLDAQVVEHTRGALQASPTAATGAAPDRLRLRLPTTTPVARGRARHSSFYSAALGRAMDYWLYLPPGYASTARRYPVLYVLHGRGGGSGEWKDYGLFDEADRLIREKRIAPLMIVSPQGDLGYWMNHAGGGERWGDYITGDLIPHIDATYRTEAEPRHRAIGGISMGGHGALQLALNNPGLFGAVGGHSAVFRAEAEAFPFFGSGVDYQRRDPVSLVQDLSTPVTFALWLDIGADDPWLPRTLYFHELLAQRGIAHVWHLDPGGHERGYWQRHLRAYLEWYDKGLR